MLTWRLVLGRLAARVSLGLLAGTLLVGLAGAGAAWLALDDAPQVPRDPQASVLDLVRAMRLLRAIDPRQQGGEGPREMALSQRELELLIDQGAQRATLPMAARVGVQAQHARLQASLSITELMSAYPGLLPVLLRPWLAGHWLNVDLGLRETAALPDIEHLRVGRLPVPAWLGEWLLRNQLEQHFGPDQLRLAREMVKGVRFTPDKLRHQHARPHRRHAGTGAVLLGPGAGAGTDPGVPHVWRSAAPDHLQDLRTAGPARPR